VSAAGEIGPLEASRLVADGQALLLDVREPFEWETGHAPAAVHVPMGLLTRDTVADGTPVVVICRSGNRSGIVADALAAVGYRAWNLVGGMQAWAAVGLAVERSDGTPGAVA
jgi:rhodanese-related sulfurtransferase